MNQDQGGGRLELECNSMGVELIEAEYSEPMTYFGDFSCDRIHDEVVLYKDLIPQVDYSSKKIEELPLLLAQLTQFKCGGLSLSMAISHTIMDGRSAFHFHKEWANLTRGHPIEALPYLDRQILQANKSSTWHQQCRSADQLVQADQLVDQFSRLPLLIGQGDNSEERKKMAVATMLPLSKSQVQKLKNAANYGMGFDREKNNGRRPYGRFEVIAAHVWRCASKARGLKSEQLTASCLCVDSRARMDPPLPARYFGNAIVDVVANSQAGELMFKPLSNTCNKIRETIEKVTNEYVRSTIEFFKTQQDLSKYQDQDDLGGNEGTFYGNPNLGIASLLNLSCSLDFGWGKEIFTAPGYCDYDGDVMILPGNENGSVMVAVGLQALHMEKFKKHFYEDIDAL